MVKRLFDVVCAAVALVLTAPLIGLAAIGIKLTDPKGGPVFYRARRVGYLGREFTMYKLRTMRQDGDDGGGPRITGARDARVYPFGQLLRRSKVDELPQLFNVLRGDMAIVGPRPEDPMIVKEHYSPPDLETLGGRPGLACLTRVHGLMHLVRADAANRCISCSKMTRGLPVVFPACSSTSVAGGSSARPSPAGRHGASGPRSTRRASTLRRSHRPWFPISSANTTSITSSCSTWDSIPSRCAR